MATKVCSPGGSGVAVRPNLLAWLPRSPGLACSADLSRAELSAWQRRARRRFQECLGGLPPRVSLRPRVLETKRMRGYTRTLYALATAPRMEALAWLCVPDGVTKRALRPAMIAVPGHGIGARDLLAMNAAGKSRKEGTGYQKDYALQAVRLGYPCLVIEPLGFGDRRDEEMKRPGGESGCHAASTIALMLGMSLAGLRVNEMRLGLDFFQTVPGVDPERIGIMGISGGGLLALFTAAVESRIKAAIVSGYFNQFRDSVLGMDHCICNFVPGLAADFDMVDVAALVAPRPLLVQHGTRDPIFPIEATRAALKRLRSIYRGAGAEENLESEIFEGGHEWSPRRIEAFLARAL